MSFTSYGTQTVDFDEDLTPEEKEAIRHAEGAQAFGTGLGTTIGGVAGTAASTIPVLTPFAPAIVPAASALGGWLGSTIGGNIAEENAKKAERMREERLKKLNKAADDQNVVNQLLSDWAPRIRGF